MGINGESQKNEDQREAVRIGVNLSSQLIGIGLTLMVAGATLTSVIFYKYSYINYYFLSGVFIFSALSIFLGGKGIDKARKEGHEGNWSLEKTSCLFNWQAIILLLGFLFFIAFLFFIIPNNKEVNESSKKEAKTQYIKSSTINRH